MISIIPQPTLITVKEGEIRLNPTSRIFAWDAELKGKAQFLAHRLRTATGFPFEIVEDPDVSMYAHDLAIAIDLGWHGLGREGYRITTCEGQPLTISASTARGIGYGIQTLLQLLPPAIFDRGPRAKDFVWVVPRVMIEDSPRFAWRGAMLDCARHFMPKEYIKQFIDLLAMHKLNIFHWHLTDNQGWRLEIKKYPRLTEIGSYRRETLLGHLSANGGGDGIPHEGYYSQDDAREIVAYAAERNITVVPEIEMPGHSQAAIAAYPELGSIDEKVEVATAGGFHPHIFNVKESTISFLQDILSEVLDVFPGSFIHIGGDEAVKTQWEESSEVKARMAEVGAHDLHELQSWFIRRMGEFLTKRGRNMVGWDEILEGGLAPDAVVMSWRGTAGGIAAAREGHDVVMAPTTHTYFDYYQSSDISGEPLAISDVLTLETVYGYEPIPVELTTEQARHILGVQGQLWTSYISTPSKVEYMAFPRLSALAEVGWSSPSVRDYASFLTRLPRHLQRFNALGVNYRPLD